MHIKNATFKLIVLSKHIKLDYIINFKKEECYYVNVNNAYLAIRIS